MIQATRQMIAHRTSIITAFAFTAGIATAQAPVELHEGDLLFQHIGGEQGHALQLATGSAWTHVGITMLERGKWVVVEAVGPVKRTPLAEWIEQGDGAYMVKRYLKDGRPLGAMDIERLRGAIKPFLGAGYDLEFRWSDELIYCSELVWKVFERALGIRLCDPMPMRSYHLGDPVVQRVMLDRYGSAPPLDEPMVAPSTLLACPLLTRVGEQ